jgi:hypothetical protein
MVSNGVPSSDLRDKDNDQCRKSDNALHRRHRGVRALSRRSPR